MTQLDTSWHRAWNNLGLAAPEGLRERLIAAYDEPHRRYHSRQHLQECIDHLDGAIDLAIHPGEVEIALWFHDAIYDPSKMGNEQRSAKWALDALQKSGACDGVLARVRALIMATRHAAIPEEADQQLLVDIDLAILGAPPARFAEYAEQVKAEYAWLPDVIYRVKRKEVLKGFLDRPAIYSTPHFRALYETQARANLHGAIR